MKYINFRLSVDNYNALLNTMISETFHGLVMKNTLGFRVESRKAIMSDFFAARDLLFLIICDFERNFKY